MKSLFKILISFINKIYLILVAGKTITGRNKYYLVKFKKSNSDTIDFKKVTVEKTVIHLTGSGNTFRCSNAFIAESTISVQGDNNEIFIASGVKLRKAEIIIRGDNCKLIVETNTTFGSVRIVNVGTSNNVIIGSGCLFSDQIEIWASDTHPIFNNEGTIINKEKPIKIGNNVWVGSRVNILKGVTINDGSIIGMGSTISKDVPAAVIVAGSPPKIIKENISWSLHYPQPPYA